MSSGDGGTGRGRAMGCCGGGSGILSPPCGSGPYRLTATGTAGLFTSFPALARYGPQEGK